MAAQTMSMPVRLESLADRMEVAPGVHMPRLGLGTWRAQGAEGERAIEAALRMGYSLIDTSANYYNEEEVGRAVARSGVPRDEVFVTTKLEGPDQGYETTRRALEASLNRLGMHYVDLYLIHWPIPEKTQDTWRALQELQQEGLALSIGVSNFEPHHIEQILQMATIRPAVNQIELNPAKPQRLIHEYCRHRNITVQAWAPVIKGHAGRIPQLASIAKHHGKTAEQVSLRWILQKDMSAIPKTVHEERLRQNADVFDFELSAEEMRAIDAAGEE